MSNDRSAAATRVWYEHGLRFQCQDNCTACCGGAPGYVWLSEAEQEQMASHLGLDLEAFRAQYVRRLSDGDSLRERRNFDCVLLDRSIPGCSVYPVRPTQCRTFPFWPEHLVSRQAWQRLKHECPGIDIGRLWTREQIDEIARRTSEAFEV